MNSRFELLKKKQNTKNPSDISKRSKFSYPVFLSNSNLELKNDDIRSAKNDVHSSQGKNVRNSSRAVLFRFCSANVNVRRQTYCLMCKRDFHSLPRIKAKATGILKGYA